MKRYIQFEGFSFPHLPPTLAKLTSIFYGGEIHNVVSGSDLYFAYPASETDSGLGGTNITGNFCENLICWNFGC